MDFDFGDVQDSADLLCSICAEKIPHERDDTIIWQDVRFAISRERSEEGRFGYGPLLSAHPECFKLVGTRMNSPCAACGHPIAPIPSRVAKRARWACGTCHREFEEGLLGELKEVAPPAPVRHRPGKEYVADRIEDIGRRRED